MSHKLNIAILIAGEPRFGPEVNRTVSNLLGYTTITWFFFLWDVPNTTNANRDLIAPYWKNVTYENAWAKIKANIGNKRANKIGALKIEKPDAYRLHFPIKNRAGCCFNEYNVWSMWQSWYHGFQLVSDYGQKFDLVLRLRGDCALVNELDLRDLKKIIDENPKKLFVPKNEWFGFTRRINDWMAISSMENIATYCRVKETVPTLQSEGIVYHPENTLAEHLFRNDIDYYDCLLYTSPSPRDLSTSRMPSSA